MWSFSFWSDFVCWKYVSGLAGLIFKNIAPSLKKAFRLFFKNTKEKKSQKGAVASLKRLVVHGARLLVKSSIGGDIDVAKWSFLPKSRLLIEKRKVAEIFLAEVFSGRGFFWPRFFAPLELCCLSCLS